MFVAISVITDINSTIVLLLVSFKYKKRHHFSVFPLLSGCDHSVKLTAEHQQELSLELNFWNCSTESNTKIGI